LGSSFSGWISPQLYHTADNNRIVTHSFAVKNTIEMFKASLQCAGYMHSS